MTTAIVPWFERRFDLCVPPELLPNLCARLRGTAARMEDAFRCGDSEAPIRRANGGWSAQEHAGHLGDMEGLWLARVDDFAFGRSAMTAADLQNRRTHEANHNERPLGRILDEFRAQRAVLLTRLESLDEVPSAVTLPHPRMQTPMRLADHLYFVAEHDDHHLAHMHRLLQAR